MEFSSDSSLIQVTVDEFGVATLKINRPEKRNALSQKTIDSLVSAIAMVERDSKIRVAILTGSRTAGPFSGTVETSFLDGNLSTIKPPVTIFGAPPALAPAIIPGTFDLGNR